MTIIDWIEDFMINIYEDHGKIHAIAWNHAQAYYNFIQMEKVGVIELTHVSCHSQFVAHVGKIFTPNVFKWVTFKISSIYVLFPF
jgi:hypothetical protein